MQKRVLLALLVILSRNLACAKSFEESSDEVLTLEKRDEPVKDVEEAEVVEEDQQALNKREPENKEIQEDEDVEKREPEIQEEDEEKDEVVEKREEEEEEEEDEEERGKVEEEKREETEVQEDKVEEEKRRGQVEEEKREETEVQESTSADSKTEVSEVEDLEARAIQASFTLVDWRGRRINGQQEGLLLYRGGTVCDDYFSMNSAHAICRTMGFDHATRWRHGQVYGSFQSRKRILLDNVRCSSTHWASCRSSGRHNCNHHEDVLLTCTGTGFKLVNSAGHPVTGRREGLLTYQHGTVCDDYFNYNAAHAICRTMGYAYARRWRRGYRYGAQQRHRRIVMDDVRCRASYWNYCSYRTRHNCNHHEDVFLTCQPGGTHPPGFRLVNWRGQTTRTRNCEGLLIYNGGTVCDDHFNMNAAHAICRSMRFRGAVRYRNGLAYGNMQRRKQIRMDDVRCRSTTWSSCRFNTRHNCGHSEDILLTCR